MTEFQAIVLGLIQGLTEFLPVSSSGHLIFIPALLGWSDQGVAFDLVMHLGTLAAVTLYFRKKLWSLICGVFSRGTERLADRRFGWMIGLSAVPAAIIGLFLETNERNAVLVGVNLIFWGLVLGFADYYSKRKSSLSSHAENDNSQKSKSLIAMSFAQALALIPGTSRSGITMTAGLFSGLSRKDAAEISFLMSVPITALAGADALFGLWRENFIGIDAAILSFGFLAALASGFLAIRVLLKIIERWSFMPFVVYRVIVGVFILWFLA